MTSTNETVRNALCAAANARPLVASCNAYAVDKNGRQIKKGMTLKDEDGDRFYVEKVLYKNVVEDEWGNQHLETDRWAEVVRNATSVNSDDPGHFTSSELSALKGAFNGLKGAKFSQYPNRSREKLSVRGDGDIEISVEKTAWEGKPVQFDVRGHGPRSAFKVKFVSSIRDAVAAMKRMMAAAKKQSPYAFGTSDFYD